MTVFRLPLIIPLLLLAAAAPETAPTATPPSAPSAEIAPNPLPAATAPNVPSTATAPSVPPTATAPNPPPATTAPNPPPATTAPSVPPAATAAKPPAEKGPKLPPTVALQKVAPEAAMPILGHTVVGPGGKVIARLVDVLVDTAGQPVAAVLDFGGFMGVGTRKIAVHWDSLHFEPGATTHQVILMLTSNEIKAAPEYKGPSNAAPVIVPAATAAQPGPQ